MPAARARRSFAEALDSVRTAPASAIPESVRAAARSIAQGERLVARAIGAARHGQELSNEQLLALQAGVYRYTQELELASKLVDKLTGAIKQTLQSQQ